MTNTPNPYARGSVISQNKLIVGDQLSMTYKSPSTTYERAKDFSHSLALERTAPVCHSGCFRRLSAARARASAVAELAVVVSFPTSQMSPFMLTLSYNDLSI